MSNDPTTTPSGESDMPQSSVKSSRSRSSNRANAPYPEMMGDGTEEQNLNQVGDPSARIREDEVDAAFAGSSGAPREPRSFIDKEKAMDAANTAKDAAVEKLSAMTQKVNAVRDQVQQSAGAAREWAVKQADAAAGAAKQLHTDKPVLVLSVSAGAALAVGLLAGFVIGRATADEY
jgi:ElaB/YqjD/DUF883 family membrane-anchored ribosome-binding protein